MRWLQNAYNYNTNTAYESWTEAYFYYLWSSSKAYNLMKRMAVAPGNIGPMTSAPCRRLSAGGRTRLVNRDPLTDTRPAPRGAWRRRVIIWRHAKAGIMTMPTG